MQYYTVERKCVPFLMLTTSFFIFIFSFPNALSDAAHIRQCNPFIRFGMRNSEL